MMLLIPGRKCWVLVDCWEKYAVAQAKIVTVCGGVFGSEVLVEFEGETGIAHIATNALWATRREAERARRRYNKKNGAVPGCCKRCSHYLPQFWAQLGKECSAFGTVEGVKNGHCGFFAPKD